MYLALGIFLVTYVLLLVLPKYRAYVALLYCFSIYLFGLYANRRYS